jgi:hypothetical protein
MWAATIIQTIAAIVQACAAGVFLAGVRRDGRERERARQDAMVEKLHRRWMLAPAQGATDTERAGYPLSPRQVATFNRWLAEAGERWRIPPS